MTSRARRRQAAVERSRAAKFVASAEAVLTEQIQRDLGAGKTDDEARFHAHRTRYRFLLPVPDMRLEHILWKEVAVYRGGLV